MAYDNPNSFKIVSTGYIESQVNNGLWIDLRSITNQLPSDTLFYEISVITNLTGDTRNKAVDGEVFSYYKVAEIILRDVDDNRIKRIFVDDNRVKLGLFRMTDITNVHNLIRPYHQLYFSENSPQDISNYGNYDVPYPNYTFRANQSGNIADVISVSSVLPINLPGHLGGTILNFYDIGFDGYFLGTANGTMSGLVHNVVSLPFDTVTVALDGTLTTTNFRQKIQNIDFYINESNSVLNSQKSLRMEYDFSSSFITKLDYPFTLGIRRIDINANFTLSLYGYKLEYYGMS